MKKRLLISYLSSAFFFAANASVATELDDPFFSLKKGTPVVGASLKGATNAPTLNCVERPNTPPVAAFDWDTSELSITLDASPSYDLDSDSLSYEWNIDGLSKSGLHLEHRFPDAGVYEVRLTVSDGKTETTSTQRVEVETDNTRPTADFDYVIDGLSINVDGSFSADADNDALDFSWDFGGVSESGPILTHTFAEPGYYKITLTVDDGIQKHARVKRVAVGNPTNRAPRVGFDFTTSSLTVAFRAWLVSDPDGDPLTYTWDFGGDIISGSPNIEHTFPTPGTYEVTLTVSDGEKSVSKAHTITVNQATRENEAPGASFSTIETNFRAGLDADWSWDMDEDLLSYTWEIEGEKYLGRNQTVYFPAIDVYEATLIVSDGIDSDSTTQTIHLIPSDNLRPDAEFTYTAHDLTLSVDASTTIVWEYSESIIYTWDFDGVVAHGLRATHTFPAAGTYNVTLTAYDGLEYDSITKSVTVTAPGITPPLARLYYFGFGLEVSFSSSAEGLDGDALTYLWDFGDGSPQSNEHRLEHVYAEPGNYTVTVTISNGITTLSTSETITVLTLEDTPPTATFNYVDNELYVSFYGGDSYDLMERPIVDYQWDFGDGSTGTGVGVGHEYASPGSYLVTLTISNGRTTDSYSEYIEVRYWW